MDNERFKILAEYFIRLIRFGVGISDKIPEKPENIEWAEVYKLSKNHSLNVIAYQALKKANTAVEEDVWQKWERKYRLAIQADTEQLFAWDEIKELAEKYAFKVLPMKGINVKKLYPCPSLRQMGDIDLLYEKEDFKKIKQALEDVGYVYETSSSESNHQVFKRLPVMDVEMHRDLFACDHPFYAYYVNPFSRAQRTELQYVYTFSLNDEYIYTVLHAAKHYFSYGSGVRTFLDMHIFLSHYQSELDFSYIEKELAKADELAKQNGADYSIVEFEKSARELANDWFNGDEVYLSETALCVISGGVYGVLERGWKRAYEKEGKKYLWRRLFPSYKAMCKRSPILKKLPFLLPFFWIGRLFKVFKSKTAKQEYRYIKSQEKKNKNTKKA